MLHKEYMFALVYLAYDKGWQLEGNTIATQANPFSTQWEQKGIILPSNKIIKITRVCLIKVNEKGIKNKGH